MRMTVAILLLLTAAPAAAQRSEWREMAVPSWSALGLEDRTGQIREGGVITSWFRFVDAPGRPPAEDDPEVVDAMRDGGHVDLRASLDCPGRRFRVEGTRIVDRDGAVLDVGQVPDGDRFWVPLGERTRAAAAYAALCVVDGGKR